MDQLVNEVKKNEMFKRLRQQSTKRLSLLIGDF